MEIDQKINDEQPKNKYVLDPEFSRKYNASRKAGLSDEEIGHFLSKKDPEFARRYDTSLKAGFSPTEVFSRLSKRTETQEEPGFFQSVGRHAVAAGRGIVQSSPASMVYDVAATLVNERPGRHMFKREGDLSFNVPTTAEIYDKIGEKLGIDTKPRSPSEKATELAFNLRELGKKTVGNLAKGNSLAKREIMNLAASAPLATTAVAGHEIFGVPEWATLVLSGGTIPAIKKAVQGAKDLIKFGANEYLHFNLENVSSKNFLSSIKQEWGNARREALQKLKDGSLSAQQYQNMKPYLDIAAKYNIPINVGSLTDSRSIKRMERIISKRELTEEAAQKFRQKSAEAWGNSYINAVKRISQTHKFQDKGSVADSLLSNVTQKRHQELIDTYTDLYGKAREGFKGSQNLAPDQVQKLENSLNVVIDKVGQSLVPTSAEKSTKAIAQEAKSGLSVSPKEAGKPELQGVTMETGEGMVQKATASAENKIQTAIDNVDKTKLDLSSAEEKLKKVKAQRDRYLQKKTEIHGEPKKTAQKERKEISKISQKLDEAVKNAESKFSEAENSHQKAQDELKRQRSRLEQVGKKKQKRLIETQEDFEKIFGENAKNMRFDPKTGKISFVKSINASNLTDTIRSLNSYVEWDNPEVRNLMKGFLNETKSLLGSVYGKSHPEAYKNYIEANKTFGEASKIFGENSRFKKWGIKSDSTPEELLRTIGDLSRFKQFEKEFGGTDQGRQLIDELKRLKVEEKLAPFFENWTPGTVNKNLKKLFRDPEFNYMVPKEVRQDLQALGNLDAQIQRTSSRIYQDSQTAQNMPDLVNDMLMLLNPKAWATKLALNVTNERAQKAFASVLFDPNITHQMKKIGEDTLKASINAKTKPSTVNLIRAEIEDLIHNIIDSEKVVASQFMKKEEETE